jgi:hypothetical protein
MAVSGLSFHADAEAESGEAVYAWQVLDVSCTRKEAFSHCAAVRVKYNFLLFSWLPSCGWLQKLNVLEKNKIQLLN